MSTCWNCQAPVQAGDAECRGCGTTLTLGAETTAKEPDLPCRTCGESTPYGALFCGNCGTRDPHGPPGVVELDRGAEEREANLVDAVEVPAPIDRTMVSPATLAARAIEELEAESPSLQAVAPASPTVDLEAEVTHPHHRTAPPAARPTVIEGGSRPVALAEPAPVMLPEGDTVQETQRPGRRPKPPTHQSITKTPRALVDKPAPGTAGEPSRARAEGTRPKLSVTPAPRPAGSDPAASASTSRPPARSPALSRSQATTTPDAARRPTAGPKSAAPVARIAVKPAVVVTAPQPVAATPAAEPPSGGDESDDLTEDIAEVRFFILQGLDDEARAALAALRAAHPGHPELDAVARELAAAATAETPVIEAREAESPPQPDAAREAKEKAEREAKEKAEREAKEKAEREAKEKAEREAKARVDAEAERRMIEIEDAELALTQAEQERLDEAERAERAEASARRVTAEEQAAIEAARLAADAARLAEREAQEAERAAVLAREKANAKKREAEKAAAAAEAAQRAAKRIAVSREVKAAVAERAKEAEIAKVAELARATEAARLARAAAEAARADESQGPELEIELPDDFDAADSAAALPVVGADSSDIELGAVVDLVRRESAVLDLGESQEVDLRLAEAAVDEPLAPRGRTMPSPVVPRGGIDPYDDETTPAPGPAPRGAAEIDALPEEAAPELVEEMVLDRGRGSSGLLEVDLDDVEEIEDGEIVEDAEPPIVVRDPDLPPPEDLAVDLDDLDELAPDPGPARTGRTIPPGLVTSASARTENTVITRGPQPARPFDDEPAAADDPDREPRPPAMLSRTTVVPGDPGRPAEPAPYRTVPPDSLVDPFAAAAASGEFRSEENTEPSPPPAPAAVVRTHDGTVIAPMVGGKAGIPVAPIRLVSLGVDGEPTAERALGPGEAFEIGRQAGHPWAADSQMSVRHVKVRPAPGGAILDELSPNAAVFIKVAERSAVRDGDEFKVGQSQLRWQKLPPGSDSAVLGHLTVFKHGAPAGEAYPIGGAGLLLGRDEGDVVFPDDTFVSGHHCRFTCEGFDVYVEDLGSSNGTYLRVRSGEAVSFGSLLLVGHTQFLVEPG